MVHWGLSLMYHEYGLQRLTPYVVEWLAAALEEGLSIPEPDSIDDYSGQFKLRIPKTLHRQLALQSKREGFSMNQYCVYLLSQNSAVRA